MTLDPNPELYPPYSNQTYVKVHEQDLQGVIGNSVDGSGNPTLPSPDYNTQKYSFWGRNPRFEIAQTIDAYKQNTEEFTACDTTLTAYLTGRTTANAETIYTYLKSKVPNQDSNQQYVLGLTASMGGGQNTTYYANSISVAQNLEIVVKATELANGIPIITPFESPLISDAHASAVEAKNAGEIRDQQLRQSLQSANGVRFAQELAEGNNYSWDGTSVVTGVYGQLAAASQT
jgi:hypothetical protein